MPQIRPGRLLLSKSAQKEIDPLQHGFESHEVDDLKGDSPSNPRSPAMPTSSDLICIAVFNKMQRLCFPGFEFHEYALVRFLDLTITAAKRIAVKTLFLSQWPAYRGGNFVASSGVAQILNPGVILTPTLSFSEMRHAPKGKD